MDFRDTFEALEESLPRDMAWVLSTEAMHPGTRDVASAAWRLWICADRVWIAAQDPEELVMLARQYAESGRPVGIAPAFYP